MSYTYSLKLIIIGDCSVGKSCLMQRFLSQHIRELHEPTVGVEFGAKVLKVNNEEIKLQIWDTAGSEQFKSITRTYYRSAAAAILVYDITNRNSFDHLAVWLEEARVNGNPSISVIVVGNKIDLGAQRKVAFQEGLDWANQNGLLFLEASAKTNQRVEEVFMKCSMDVLEKIKSGEIDLSNQASGIAMKVKRNISNSEQETKCCG